jgi:serine/threonine protein kinase
MIHSKFFQDPYSQLREHFFLELLTQHGAPVPKVLRNDIESKRIDIEYGGQDLRKWMEQRLSSSDQNSTTRAVIRQALQAVIRIADVGVIHLDVAPRNFVLDLHNSSGLPRVRMIDFTLAVSPLLPLQKPLWILPHASTQYPALQASIIQDWQAFFIRHDLPLPTNWDQSFDIPLQTYSEDWIDWLAVDHIDLRQPLLAHSLGILVQQFNEILNLQKIAPDLLIAAQNCLNLKNNDEATTSIQLLMAAITEQDNETPRPQAKNIEAFETLPPATKRETINHNREPLEEYPPWKNLLTGLLLCGLGFACVNYIYTTRNLRLTDFGFSVLMVFATLWGASLLWALFYGDRVKKWLAQLILPALALSVITLELWSVHTQQDLWFASLCFITIATFLFSRK